MSRRPLSQMDIFLNNTPENMEHLLSRLDAFKTNPAQAHIFLMALIARGMDLNNPFPENKQNLVEKALLTQRDWLFPVMHQAGISIMHLPHSNSSTFEKVLDYNESNLIEFFLKSNLVDVNQELSDGSYPVHRVAREKNIRMLKLFSEMGADFNVLDKEQKQARSYFRAVDNNELDLFEKLSREGVKNYLLNKIAPRPVGFAKMGRF